MDKPPFDPSQPFNAADKPPFDPSKPTERGVVDKLLGVTGERYQTWPEKAVRGVASEIWNAPKDMIDAAASNPPGSPEASEAMAGPGIRAAATLAPVNPAIRAGDKLIPGVTKAIGEKPTQIPTATELAASGGADINAATKSNLAVSPQAVADFSRIVQQKIGVHPVNAEKTFALLKELENPSGNLFTAANLQALRESLGHVAQNFNPNAAKDQLAATRAIKEFDTFLRGLSPKDTVARTASSEGPATRQQLIAAALEGKREAGRVADLFERGRGNYAAGQRANDITGELDRATTGILERAEGRATASHSGRNLDNTLRSKVESVLEKPKELSGLNDAEIAALEHARDGGGVRNTAREIGNRLAGGGGVGSTVLGAGGGALGGAALGSPVIGAMVGAAIPTGIGLAARGTANALAKRDLRLVDELMRKRSPIYEERAANPETYVISPEKRAALARALMMEGSAPQQ